MEVAARFPVPVGFVPWATREPKGTVIVKATFDVSATGIATRSRAPDPLRLEERDPRGLLIFPSDFSPFKGPTCDVVLVGAALSRAMGPLTLSVGGAQWFAQRATELGAVSITSPAGDPTDPTVVNRWSELGPHAFHVARPEQRVSVSAEPIVVRVEHADTPAWFRVPALPPWVLWLDPQRRYRAVPIPTRLDALCLDLVARRCSMVWRAWTDLPARDTGLLAIDWESPIDPVDAVGRWPRVRAATPRALREAASDAEPPTDPKAVAQPGSTVRMVAVTTPVPPSHPSAATSTRRPAMTVRLTRSDPALPFGSSPDPDRDRSSGRQLTPPISPPLADETVSLTGEELEDELERTYDLEDTSALADERRAAVEPEAPSSSRTLVTHPVAVGAALPFRDAAGAAPGVTEQVCQPQRAQTVTGVRPDLAPPLPFVLSTGGSSVPLGFTALPGGSSTDSVESDPSLSWSSEDQLSMTVDVPGTGGPALPFASSQAAPPAPPPTAEGPSRVAAVPVHTPPTPSYLQRAVVPEARPMEGPSTPVLRIQGLTLEEYASVKAALWAGDTPRREILRRHGMTDLKWRTVEKEWERSLACSNVGAVDAVISTLRQAVRQRSPA